MFRSTKQAMAIKNFRDTAIKAVQDLLANLPMHLQKNKYEDAIRMVDREIGGLLGHQDSPVVSTFRDYTHVLFPGGLEKTDPGKDIILVLNSQSALIEKRGEDKPVELPKALKNPEKGIEQIIGIDLALKLFTVRGQIFKYLVCLDAAWQVNALANTKAIQVLLRQYVKKSLTVASLETKRQHYSEAFELIERTIGFLLAQPLSKVASIFLQKNLLFACSKGNTQVDAKKKNPLLHRSFEAITELLGKEWAVYLFAKRQSLASHLPNPTRSMHF